MCHWEVADVYCRREHCNGILAYKAVIKDVECDLVLDNNEEFGWCGRKGEVQIGPQRSTTKNCHSCNRQVVEEQKELYENLGQHLAESREVQRGLDIDRRARAERRRHAAQHSDMLFEEQAALAFRAVTERSAGQEGYGHGASGIYTYPGRRGDENQPGPEGDMDETTGGGWDDPGEGSSRGYDQRYTQEGSQGQNRRSGRY